MSNKKNLIKWEDIFYNESPSAVTHVTSRAKVLGGWLVNHTIALNKVISNSICFYSDVNHEWEPKNNNDNK